MNVRMITQPLLSWDLHKSCRSRAAASEPQVNGQHTKYFLISSHQPPEPAPIYWVVAPLVQLITFTQEWVEWELASKCVRWQIHNNRMPVIELWTKFGIWMENFLFHCHFLILQICVCSLMLSRSFYLGNIMIVPPWSDVYNNNILLGSGHIVT